MVDHVPREHAVAGAGAGTLLIGRRIAPAVLAALALAGCGGGTPAAREAASSDARPAAAPAPVLEPASADQLLERVHGNGARATVLNVWATWCGPCREEMPDLLRLREAYRDRGLDLVLVSGDFDEQLPEARAFLAERGVEFTTYVKTGRDMEFIDTLNPEWSGALPATFVYDGEGRQRDFWEGKASYAEMEQRVLPVLDGRDTGNPPP